MHIKKIILIGICILLVCGCARKKGKEITFAVGGAPAEVEFWETLVREFEAESGIKVHMVQQPTDTDQRRQGLLIPLSSKKEDPDVFLMDVAWIAQFAASGWLEELTGYMEKYNLRPEEFFSRVVNLADKYKGKLVALPVYVDGGMLYYRKDLLQKYGFTGPPKTWPDLVKCALKVQAGEREKDPGFYGFVWQGAQYEGLICNFLEYAVSGGGGIRLQDQKILLDNDQNLQAVQLMHDLIHRYKISPPNTYTEMKEEEVRMFFEKGQALFERNWPYAWSLHSSDQSPVKNKIGIAPLPHFPGGESVSTLGGWHIGISKYSESKEESFRFLQFIVSSKIQKRLALQLGWNPGRKEIYTDQEVIGKMPHFVALREVFEKAYPRPNIAYYTLISEVIQRHLSSALSGKIGPRKALSSAQKESQQIVNRYER